MLRLSRRTLLEQVSMPRLDLCQFWGMVRAIGEEERLRNWVSDIADPVERAFMSSALDYSGSFEWDQPIMKSVRASLDISDREMRDLWLWAASVSSG